MKKVFILTIMSSFFLSSSAFADVDVDGYARKDGTYVAPHHRSDPNHTKDDNWSSKGNENPYTGKKGYKNP
jgi:hypothetical protein